MEKIEKILFLCVENAGRSQMAEGFFRKYTKRFEVKSAGTDPRSQLIPKVILAMKEVGVDITNQKPKLLTNEMIEHSTKTVNMGCMNKKSCPFLFVTDVIDWDIEDPKGKTIDEIRVIRDQIKSKVLSLIEKLEDDL